MSINTKKYIEEFLKIRDKNSQIINFKLNAPQMKLYNVIKEQKEQGKPVRIIILKARQMGFSTLTEAILFKETVTKKNINTGIITHVEEATNNLFNMSKLFYNELPEPIKPRVQNSNAKELIFNTRENTGLNSRIRCMTAGSSGVGRSATYNNLHLSELAFWQGDKKVILNGLMQTVPNKANTMIIIESTANGYEYFKELYDGAVAKTNDFIPVFVGWNELPEYQMKYSGFKLDKEEQSLVDNFGVTLDQLEWRRWCIRNNCGNDIDLFHQEYPISPEQAFISSGKCYFNTDNIIQRINELKEPISKGVFNYNYNEKSRKIESYQYKESSDGFISIYEQPRERIPYVIGGDTAGEGSDYFVAHVIDNTTGKVVAKLRHEFDEVEYTRQVYCLGKFYNNALIGLECNFSTYPVNELDGLGYRNQYIREVEDTYTHTLQKKLGFRTTSITRPRILAQLQTIVLEEIDKITDKETLQEMLTFIKNEKGRPEAQEGYHDDQVMSLAIAYDIRDQQSYNQEPIRIPLSYSYSNSEVGSKIEII